MKIEYEIIFNGQGMILNDEKMHELVDLLKDGDKLEIVAVRY